MMPPSTLQVWKTLLSVLLVKRENTDDSHNNTRKQRNCSHVGKQDISHRQLLKFCSFYNKIFSIDMKEISVWQIYWILNCFLGITSQAYVGILFDCNTYIELYFHAIFCLSNGPLRSCDGKPSVDGWIFFLKEAHWYQAYWHHLWTEGWFSKGA